MATYAAALHRVQLLTNARNSVDDALVDALSDLDAAAEAEGKPIIGRPATGHLEPGERPSRPGLPPPAPATVRPRPRSKE